MRARIYLAILITLSGSVSIAGDYWPHQTGAVYTYINESAEVLEVTYDIYGVRLSEFAGEGLGQGSQVTETFGEGVGGDIYLQSLLGYTNGAIDPDYYRSLGESFVFLDLPLDSGKNWISFVETSCCYSPCSVGLAATVIGPSEVTVPLGTFSVVEVSFVNISPGCAAGIPSGIMMLDRVVGPIVLPGGYELVAVSDVVSVDEQSWSAVKALYR